MNIKYFAYGSNMDPERMKKRKAFYLKRKLGRLPGWKLCFNKKPGTPKHNNEGYANIFPCKGCVVYGIIYDMDVDAKILDKYEGAPQHYRRTVLDVETGSGKIERCFVYIASPDRVEEGLKPSKEYIGHLLKGCDLLPKNYCEFLWNIETSD